MMNPKLGKEFRSHLYDWQKETGFHSNPSYMRDNDHYRTIVAMGIPVMPFIIEELRTRPCVGLFSMVREIVGDFPVIEEGDRGRVKIIARLVVKWWDERTLWIEEQ